MSEPTLSATEATILDLLIAQSRELYGLELVKLSEGDIKRGTVYVTLGRMEEKGFVESREEDETADHVGLRRRLYKPTGLGVRARRAREVARLVMAGLRLPKGAL